MFRRYMGWREVDQGRLAEASAEVWKDAKRGRAGGASLPETSMRGNLRRPGLLNAV